MKHHLAVLNWPLIGGVLLLGLVAVLLQSIKRK